MLQSNSSDNSVHHYDVKILDLFDTESQLINTKSMIKNKLKEFLCKFKKFNVQKILVLDDKKRNDCKISHSSTKLIASDSYIGEESISLLKAFLTKIKRFAYENWVFLDVIIKHYIMTFECA